MKQMIAILTLLVLPTSLLATERPNVLLISIDDLNDWTGCLKGHPQARTPNLDRLAGQGTLFSNAHCQSPVCNPSRASLLTGRHPHTSGVYFLGPDLKEAPELSGLDTLPERFAKHGYSTLAAGKNLPQGRSTFLKPTAAVLVALDPVLKRKSRNLTAIHFGTGAAFPEKDNQMPDFKIAKWAVDQLQSMPEKADKPFFMGVGFYRPHVPMFAPKKWFDLFPIDQIQLPLIQESDRDDLSDYAIALTNDKHVSPQHEWVKSAGQWEHAVQSYLASIAFADHCLGLVLDARKHHRTETTRLLYSLQIMAFTSVKNSVGQKEASGKMEREFR